MSVGSPGSAVWLSAESDRLLDFARGSVHPDGFGWLLEDGSVDLERPVELWITCRMTHAFALGHLAGGPGADLVDHGLAALRGRLHDDEHGGWYAAVARGGPEDPDSETGKAAYAHAFVVLAASSAVAAGRPGADALLTEALDVLDRHFWDDEHGMSVEQWDAAWTTLDDYRGVNANMHTVECLIAAADVLDGSPTADLLRARALRIASRVVGELAPTNEWRIPEHFDASWSPVLDYNADEPDHPFRPFGATIGHWLEWARLTLDLRAALGGQAPDWMLENAVALFDAALREGWAVDGEDGFVYTVDFEGRPVVRQRMHWVLAEAVAAAAALHEATGEASYLRWCETWWAHAEAVFIDRDGGSWWHELSPENLPAPQTWSGKPDVYHALQATLFPRLPLAPSLATALRRGLLRG